MGRVSAKVLKVIIFTWFTVFFIQRAWHDAPREVIVVYFMGLGERYTFPQLSIQGSLMPQTSVIFGSGSDGG